MSTIKLIGRTTDFKGKTLWEIVGSLKNFGVGRIVARNMFERYSEPCYYKILKVQAVPNNEETRKVKVTVEKTFRGRTYPKLIEIYSTSYKADYKLIPKHEEADYCKSNAPPTVRILPRTIELPPLLKEFIVKETGNPDPKIKVKIGKSRDKNCRIAEEGEIPNVEISMGLGKPSSPSLYEM